MFVLVVCACYSINIFRFPLTILYYFILVKFNLINHTTIVYDSIKIFFIIILLLPTLLKMKIILRSIQGKYTILISKWIRPQVILATSLLLLIILGEFLLPIYLLTPIKNDINYFIDHIRDYKDINTTAIIEKIIEYIDNNINSSWRKPESSLEIDNMLSSTDYVILHMLGFHRAHIVFFQKWGSCGEYAIATAYLLSKLGYETRIAMFNNIDHSWAEIKLNNTWYIVDPWHIGLYYENKLLVPAYKLSSIFTGNHHIIVIYSNGTYLDASKEHGYN